METQLIITPVKKIDAYETSDGQRFFDSDEAEAHQCTLDAVEVVVISMFNEVPAASYAENQQTLNKQTLISLIIKHRLSLRDALK